MEFGPLKAMVAALVARLTDEDDAPLAPESIKIVRAEVVVQGRPGLISVVADVSGQMFHAVLGLRKAGDEVQFLDGADESPLGILDDPDGLALVFDATTDAELMLLLAGAVGGSGSGGPEMVRRVWSPTDAVTVACDDLEALTVWHRLPPGLTPDHGIELLLGLDRVGFNHLLAPVARWKYGMADLGIVQEYQPGSSGGWALALTSLRDLYASGGAPEAAGGDFAVDARRLGTMTARMHLGLDQAFGRRTGNIATWVAAAEEAVGHVDPALLLDESVGELLESLRRSSIRCAAIRTHGDFHLGRVSRADLGWFVHDFSPGGVPVFTAGVVRVDEADDDPVFRSPLADVADMLWSFHHVADVAATERDPSGLLGLDALAQAWEVRNRRAFLAGYLATRGIGGLVPPSRDAVRNLAAVFELERSASKLALRT